MLFAFVIGEGKKERRNERVGSGSREKSKKEKRAKDAVE
jgi:hypothetical protein